MTTITCPHCGKLIQQERGSDPWYYRTPIIVAGFLCVGPFALPLVWFHPRYSRLSKVVVTIGVIVLTYFVWKSTERALHEVSEFLKIIQG